MKLTDIMSHAGLAFWPQVALVLFLAIFAVVAVVVLVRGRRGGYQAVSRLPLEDDDPMPREPREPRRPGEEE